MYICTTAQNMKFSIKDFFSKCEQIRSLLLESFMFCIVQWEKYELNIEPGQATKLTMPHQTECYLLNLGRPFCGAGFEIAITGRGAFRTQS